MAQTADQAFDALQLALRAKNAAAMTSGRAAFEDEGLCEEILTAEQAEDRAKEEFLSCPEKLAAWLNMVCMGNEKPLNVMRIERRESLTVPQLLAVVLGGNSWHALNARDKLAEEFIAAHEREIAERAAELMKERQ